LVLAIALIAFLGGSCYASVQSEDYRACVKPAPSNQTKRKTRTIQNPIFTEGK